MLVAKYWAEEKLVYTAPKIRKGQKGAQIVIKRKGWSNESLEAAQKHAHERAKKALEEIIHHPNTDAVSRHEPAPGYNGVDGLPICEEVISTSGDTAITRNSYGALCLNTPDVMFVDIDQDSGGVTPFTQTPKVPARYLTFLFILLFIPLHAYFGTIGRAFWISLFTTFALNFIINGLFNKNPLEKRIDEFAAKNPTWCFNLYRTAAGFRLLILHQRFDPSDSKTWEAFNTLGVDPIYHRMCCLQKCFRARLTPKPWRIEMDTIPKGKVYWRSEFLKDPERLEWAVEYEQASTKYAVCTLIKQYGQSPTVLDPKIHSVLMLHDQYTKIDQSLPLA